MNASTRANALYPPIEPFRGGMLPVDALHTLYWEECGNPSGVPVLFLHGGPGAGLSPRHRQFFDPAHDSLIPELASDEELLSANSFLSIAAFGSTAIGFAAAGLLASTVDLYWAFIIDAGTFVFSAGCIALMGRYPMPVPEDDASVAVVIANLKAGFSTLFGTPIIRSLFVVGALMFFSFGLWNVLLLPMSPPGP